MRFSLILWWIKKGIKDVYEIYFTEAKKIYYDDLSSLQLVYVVMGKVSIFLNGKISKFNAGDLIIFNQFENKFIYASDDNLLLITKISIEYLKSIGEEYYISRFENTVNNTVNDEIFFSLLNLYKSSLSIGNEELNMCTVHKLINMLKKCISPNNTISNIENKSYYLKNLKII